MFKRDIQKLYPQRGPRECFPGPGVPLDVTGATVLSVNRTLKQYYITKSSTYLLHKLK